MCDFEDKNTELDDFPTLEEQLKIEEIQIATFIPQVKKQPKPAPSIFSVFSSIFFREPNPVNNVLTAAVDLGHANVTQTQSAVAKFDIAKFLYLEKSVIINNISGKNAYVIISSNPIKTVESVAVNAGAGGAEVGIDVSFEDKGHYEVQKISISNNTSSRCCLDNTQFRCTLFFNIDGIWKKSWNNRRFDGRRYNLNILEKHVEASLKKEDIPDF